MIFSTLSLYVFSFGGHSVQRSRLESSGDHIVQQSELKGYSNVKSPRQFTQQSRTICAISAEGTNRNKSRLLFSSAEMFKKPLWQTV